MGEKKMFLILFLEIMNINILTLYSSQYFWCIVSYLLYIIEVYYILVFNFVGVSWYNKIYNLMFFDKYILPCNYPPYKDREHIYNPNGHLCLWLVNPSYPMSQATTDPLFAND